MPLALWEPRNRFQTSAATEEDFCRGSVTPRILYTPAAPREADRWQCLPGVQPRSRCQELCSGAPAASLPSPRLGHSASHVRRAQLS